MIDAHESCTHCFITYNCCNCLQIQGSTAARRLSLHARRTVVLYDRSREATGKGPRVRCHPMNSPDLRGPRLDLFNSSICSSCSSYSSCCYEASPLAFFKITVSFSPLSSILGPLRPSLAQVLPSFIPRFSITSTLSRSAHDVKGKRPLWLASFALPYLLYPKSHSSEKPCKCDLQISTRRLS